MAVTIRDVAALAGVSPSTVSRTCQNSPSISEDTKRRVRQAAKQLGYAMGGDPAQSPAPRTIGVILPPSAREVYENPFYLEMIRGINQFCNAHQYVSTIVTGRDNDEILAAIRLLVSTGAANAFILLYSRQGDTVIDYLVQAGLMYVLIGKAYAYANKTVYIDNDNFLAGQEATEYLIRRGHRRIAYLGSDNAYFFTADRRRGYQAALEIAYGNYVEGIGGGICQVSSTLYNAVVNAGLTVNKRTPHAIPSSYVDKGKDATVSDDRYDFVFTNNTGANIYIETQFVKVKGYWTSRFIIYGRPDPNGYTYKLDSQVVETIPLPEPTYEKDKTGEHVIYDDETQIKYKGREGYVVDVYLVTMDSNGLEISREKKYTDTYKAAAPIYYVGVTPRETLLPDTPSID